MATERLLESEPEENGIAPVNLHPQVSDESVPAARQLLDVLEEAGIRYVIGMPGGGTMPVYSAMAEHQGVDAVLVRSEHTAAIMADGYARATGNAAAIMGQGPFIASLGSLGLMEALTSSSPLVLIGDTSDHGMSPLPVAQSSLGEYGTPDLPAFLRAVTKYTSVATTSQEAVTGLQMAIKQAYAGNPGPTALVMRSAAVTSAVPATRRHVGSGYLHRVRQDANAADIRAAVELIAGAEFPVVYAGKGVHNAQAHAELGSFAQQHSLPVVTSYKGTSALAASHPMYVGATGTYGRPAANAIAAQADLLVVIGAKLTTADTLGGSLLAGKRIIQIDIEPRNLGWGVTPDIGLIGDARAVLRQLIEASSTSVREAGPAIASIRAAFDQDPSQADPAALEESSPVKPQRLATLVSRSIDPRSNVCLDAGFNRVWMGYYHHPAKPHSVFAPGGMACMGWALPAALGVKLARPDEPAVAVTGDGGFMIAVDAFASALERDLPVTVIVFNDSGLGMVRHHQAVPYACDFRATDYAAIARGFGGVGINVHDSRDIPSAIEEAQASGRPTVVDVQIDRSVNGDIHRANTRTQSET